MKSEYKNQLLIRLDWVQKKFGDWSEVKLRNYVDENLEHWGNELSIEMTKL